jgi:[ribosomal protein S5]-alanine N-acetyltransferase
MSVDSAFSRFPVLTTERLVLRGVRVADAEAVFAFRSDPEVSSRYGKEPNATVIETRDWVEARIADYGRRESLVWVIVLKGEEEAIGTCCFWNFDPSFRTAEVGYELHRTHWGKGITTEAVSVLLRFGFVEMDLHRIEACLFATNDSSQNVLRKLGFRFEGNLRERYSFRGRFEDQLYYGLLREEWKELPRSG